LSLYSINLTGCILEIFILTIEAYSKCTILRMGDAI